MQWASDHLPGDFHAGFTMDDALVNIALIRDYIAEHAPPVEPPKKVIVTNSEDGSSIVTSLPQKMFCFDRYTYAEPVLRDVTKPRSASEDQYNVTKWPPYCGEGLYLMPVTLMHDIYEVSRVTELYLDPDLHDVFITGILRRKLGRGDANISTATMHEVNAMPVLRYSTLLDDLSALKSKGKFRAIAADRNSEDFFEKEFRDTWETWHDRIRTRVHIYTKTLLS